MRFVSAFCVLCLTGLSLCIFCLCLPPFPYRPIWQCPQPDSPAEINIPTLYVRSSVRVADSFGSWYCFPYHTLVRLVSLYVLLRAASFSYPLLHWKGPSPDTLKGTDTVSLLTPLHYVCSPEHHTHTFLAVLHSQLLLCKVGFLRFRDFYVSLLN